MAERRGISLSYQALRGLESGATRNPSPAVLRAVAKLYDRAYAEIVAEVVKHAFDVDFNVEGERRLSVAGGDDDELSEDFAGVRILMDRIAAGPPLEIDEARSSGHLAFSKRWLDRLGIVRPLCVRVGQRERSMLGTINPGEIVLLDCADERRTSPKTDRIYAVNVDGGSTLKRVAVLDRGLLLISDNPDKEEYPTRPLELAEDQSVLDVIVGEVMWKGQPV
jgi:transcriptional regulator with XRE-family HTH domain